MDDFDLTCSKGEVNYPLQVDMVIMKVLVCIRNVIDRGLFFTYYLKEDLFIEVQTMMDDDVNKLRRSFSFLQLNERDGVTVQKRDVYSIIENVNFSVTLEYCIKIALMFQRITIDNYESHYDGNMLMGMSETIVQCVLSFKSTKLDTKMDKIEGYLGDFMVFLLKKIASANMGCFTEGGGDFILLLTQLVRKYIQLPSLQSVAFQETSAFIIKFISFYNMKKVRRPEDLHFEKLLVFLTELFEILGAVNNGVLVRSIELENARKGCAKELCHALSALRCFLPDYFGCYIDRSIETLSTVITY